jgi:hypothetical protein
MSQIYPKFAVLFFLSFALSGVVVSAQSPTTVSPGNCPNPVAEFNVNDQGYNAPSVFGSAFDSAFYYNSTRGYWTEAGGGQNPEKTVPQGTPRFSSIVSPLYPNPNPAGTFNVGFYYIVGNAATDRFQVRVFSANAQGDQTVYNVEASSGPRLFSDFSNPNPYIDPIHPANPLFNGDQGFVCIRLNDADINNLPGTQYRVEVIYLLNTPDYAVFDNLSIGGIPDVTLPVTFLGIVANRSGNSVNVRWDVADEIGVKEYAVERSTDRRAFSVVGTIPTNGGKSKVYSFTDASAGSGEVYYRVRNIDINGRSKYSGIIKVKGTSSAESVLKAYPLPASHSVTVGHKTAATGATINLLTVEGRLLRSVTPVSGASHTPVSLLGVAPGMYLIRYENGEGERETIRIIKQ